MARLLLYNKPYRVLSQFTDAACRSTLADYIDDPHLYPAGRLDYDSEGLLLLTDSGGLQARIAEPRHKMKKQYWVQVEGIPDNAALNFLRSGLELKDGMTKAADVAEIAEPALWKRDPPIRQRAGQHTSWLAMGITEGRNRQIRRMTAAIGHPTLRLIRHQIGDWRLDALQPGQTTELHVHLPAKAKRSAGGRRVTKRRL